MVVKALMSGTVDKDIVMSIWNWLEVKSMQTSMMNYSARARAHSSTCIPCIAMTKHCGTYQVLPTRYYLSHPHPVFLEGTSVNLPASTRYSDDLSVHLPIN